MILRRWQVANAAGFVIRQIQEMEIDVVEVDLGADFITWARIFSLAKLVKEILKEIQQRWEAEILIEPEKVRRSGVIPLNGMTRLVAASSMVLPHLDGIFLISFFGVI